jgi:2-polyprenyl-3-methyl-5-hydroxy-6-metoxy-1,4-benzoquinol methylase
MPNASLSSVKELESKTFRDFMALLNTLAAKWNLRQFTNWSKIWEYPWLWFNGLSQMNWKGSSLLDLGSELSPMPWFLASLGANVTLVETDQQWVPKWERLCDETGLEVKWKIAPVETLPFEDESFDAVTSFSVIEHQKDKVTAVNEAVRVLKPGGLFAISFDICEAEMDMTFPEWNGKALTMAQFEELVWNHSTLDNKGHRPKWNVEDIPPFITWHLQSAPYHNYTVGAAALRKKKI